MSEEVMIIAIVVVAVAAFATIVVYTNKSKARNFYLTHYNATDAESIEALEAIADSVSFTSLNAAAICLSVKIRKNVPGLEREDLKKRFDDMWSEGNVMRAAQSLEVCKKLNDMDTFKQELVLMVRNPGNIAK